MPRLFFTPQLARFTATPEVETAAATLRSALEAAFAVNPQLRGDVLDDQGIASLVRRMTAMNHERAWIATKKGLFELRLHGGSWGIVRVSFLGEPVTMLLPPAAGDAGRCGHLVAGGRHLLMGSTGGGLWASADAGEHGHTVSQTLPPIFALRLG